MRKSGFALGKPAFSHPRVHHPRYACYNDCVISSQQLISILRPQWGQTVIDIGSGDSKFAHDLSDAVGPHGSVVLLDLDRTGVAKPVLHTTDRQAHIVPIWGDASVLGGTHIADGRADRAILSRVLQSIDDLEGVFRELARIVPSGGRVVVVQEVSSAIRGGHAHRPDDIRTAAVRFGFVIDQIIEEPSYVLFSLDRS